MAGCCINLMHCFAAINNVTCGHRVMQLQGAYQKMSQESADNNKLLTAAQGRDEKISGLVAELTAVSLTVCVQCARMCVGVSVHACICCHLEIM